MATTSSIQTVTPANVMIIPARKVPQRYERYNKTVAVVFGSIQICLGIVSIALNATAIGLDISWPVYVGYGIWSAPVWILAGAFGIVAGYKKSKCTITATLVLSIISSGTMTYYLSLNIVQFVELGEYYWYYEPEDWGVTSGMLIAGALELVFSVLAAVQCCNAVCCCRNDVHAQHQIRHQLTAPYAYTNQAATMPAISLQSVLVPPGYKLVYTGNEQPSAQVSGQQVIDMNQSTTQSPPPYVITDNEARY